MFSKIYIYNDNKKNGFYLPAWLQIHGFELATAPFVDKQLSADKQMHLLWLLQDPVAVVAVLNNKDPDWT